MQKEDVRLKGYRATVRRALDWFGLKHDVLLMMLAVLMITSGKQLWSRYIPKYLEYLNASALIIGLYGSIQLLISALYHYLSSVLTDRLGSKKR
ncbi:MAG: hypothetical protein NDF56_01635 [archaeon GB-1845-036]|nr:hypothetical protein [Candidatus Culexmicrobium thermophilum]